MGKASRLAEVMVRFATLSKHRQEKTGAAEPYFSRSWARLYIILLIGHNTAQRLQHVLRPFISATRSRAETTSTCSFFPRSIPRR